MLMDLLGAVGVAVFGYLTYGVCKTDRKMCKLGVVGLFLLLLAYVSKYIGIDKSVAAFVLILAIVVVVGIITEKI